MTRSKREVRLVCFDTEATSTEDERGSYAVLYNWDMLHLVGDWQDVSRETVGLLTERREGRDCITLYAELDRMVDSAYADGVAYKVAVHNLSYDIQYIRKWLIDLDLDVSVCCKSSTKVLSVTIGNRRDPLVVFFDTLSIFGYSLRTLGDNLGYPKGSIDYLQDIAPDTVLSEANVAYNHRDTDILMVGICTSLLTRPSVTLGNLGTRILTKTGIVRVQDRESSHIGGYQVKKGYTLYDEDRRTVGRHVQRDEREYLRWTSYGDPRSKEVHGCYAGGVNLCNPDYLARVTEGVLSYDLKSAYPSIMLAYRIPVNPVDVTDLGMYSSMLERQMPDPMDVIEGRLPFWRGRVEFTNIEVDPEWSAHVGDVGVNETMVCQDFAGSEGVRYVDGCLKGADRLVLTLTSSIFYEVCVQFSWESARFLELTVYMGYEDPTRYSLVRVLHHYAEKSAVKGLSRGEVDPSEAHSLGYISSDEYSMLESGGASEGWMRDFVLLHKGYLNALYGIMVTSPVHDGYSLDANGLIECRREPYPDDFARDAMMWREAGVLIAEYTRYKLIYMAALLVAEGADVLYADTDSLKFRGISKDTADAVFTPLHDRIERRNVQVVDRLRSRIGFIPEAGRDVRDLGKLDYEGEYPEFVAYGHKKYAYGDGDRWRYRCSGYRLGVLDALSAQICNDGMYALAPHVCLGYDNRYDSECGIATVKAGVADPWVETSFSALDSTDGSLRHRWTGWTCPGDAILPAGKVMNNTANSKMNVQRRARAERNLGTRELYGLDITMVDGRFVYGDRGTVPMIWKGWDVL